MIHTVSQVDLHAPTLWRQTTRADGLSLRLRGHVFGGGFAQDIGTDVKGAHDESLGAVARATDGLFAAIVEDGTSVFAAVDRVGSIPLFYGWDGERWHVSDNGGALARDLGLGTDDVNPDGALALAMAGYTIGTDTLYRSLKVLTPGEAVILGPGQDERRITYDLYSAWEVEDHPDEVLGAELARVTLSILEKMMRAVEGRTIVVPLSAGLDSRLIVSGLRHLGYDNVKCFSYGLDGNHEAEAAKHIAKKLGYPWRFVPYRQSEMQAFFSSQDHANYLRFADTCTNIAFEQDLPAVRALQKDGYIPPDAVMVNGNSGDFISGNHILAPLKTLRTDLTPDQRGALIVESMIKKHFRLWDVLATEDNDARIKLRLTREIVGPLDDAVGLHGVYELREFHDRQSKYVISGQRVYDYAGLDWRLPLWDCDYLDFWRTVPLSAKVGQGLYKAMLHRENWGGVWRGAEWDFPQTIVPKWIRLPRLILKALHAPLGREAWHRFEKRFLGYWMEPLQGQAFLPYTQVAMDRRGARHMVAWRGEMLLRGKGLDLHGRPL